MTNRLPPDDELLSACFDGEATAEERARVEAWRAESSAVDAELDALGELSQLLKSLPRETAPPELCSAVLQSVERKSLPAMPVKPPVSRWRPLREVSIFLSGAAVSAACTMLAVQLSAQQSARPRAVHGLALEANPPAIAAAPADHFWHSAPAARGVAMSRTADVADSAADELALDAPRPALDGIVDERLERIAPKAAADPALTLSDKTPTDDLGAATQHAAAVPLSDVVPILANDSEGRVSNLEVYTRNLERSVDGLQKILASNGVVLEAEESGETTVLSRSVAAAPQNQPENESQLPAVYVEAPTEPLARSLEQWAQQPELVSVRLRPPLELMLDDSAAEAKTKDGQRARRLDVEQLRLAYLYSNSSTTPAEELSMQTETALSAVDAVRQNADLKVAERLTESRSRAAYRTLPVPQVKAQSAPTSPPVPPLAEDFPQTQRRFNLPLVKSGEAGKRTLRETENGRAAGQEELLARQKLANYTANASQVRMLIVFQAAVATPPATPAKPAGQPPR